MVIKPLQVNEMNDLTESLKVKECCGNIFIEFSYDRSLNLPCTVKPMHYEKALWL